MTDHDTSPRDAAGTTQPTRIGEVDEETYWRQYYEVTAGRPPWTTVIRAAEAFGDPAPNADPWRAVDLGCGGGRDARELLRRGWRVLAMDATPHAMDVLRSLTPLDHVARLETHVGDLAEFEIPPCDLVNASLILPFLGADEYAATWARIRNALAPGGRFAGMLFGDRDGLATDPAATCPPPDVIRAHLDGFEIEYWAEKEEDGHTALGEPHHFHLIEVVAVRLTAPGDVG